MLTMTIFPHVSHPDARDCDMPYDDEIAFFVPHQMSSSNGFFKPDECHGAVAEIDEFLAQRGVAEKDKEKEVIDLLTHATTLNYPTDDYAIRIYSRCLVWACDRVDMLPALKPLRLNAVTFVPTPSSMIEHTIGLGKIPTRKGTCGR